MWQQLLENLSNFFTMEKLEVWVEKGFLILLVLIVTRIAIYATDLLINRSFQLKYKREEDHRRTNTLQKLLHSVIRYVFFFIATITILDGIGIPIMAVLSAAGILGLAVGFGAQNLVKDIITGFFILFEDQFSVGEYVETQGVAGVVEEVGLRITKLRDWDGKLHIIPNGNITMVTNFHRGSMRALVEVRVSYKENIDRVLKVLEGVCKSVNDDYPTIITTEPKVVGITALGQSEVVIRIVAKTIPMEHWGIEMELRKRIKDTFEREGIEIPYPHQVVIRKDV